MSFLKILAYIFNLTLLGYITYLIYNKVKTYQLGRYFIPGLIIKVAAGIAVGLVYKYYYISGDTYAFYEEAVRLVNIAYRHPVDYAKILLVNEIPDQFAELLVMKFQPRAFFTAKLASIVNLITYNNYWLTGIYFSYFSYLGMWYLANMLASKFQDTKFYSAIAFLFFPSVLFWSSGVTKESLVMGCLCFIVGFSIPYLIISQKISYPRIILMALFLWILLKLKYYYVGVLIPVMAANFIVAFLRLNFKFVQKNYYTHFGSWLLVFTLILLFASTIHPNLRAENFLQSVVTTHNQIYELSSPEDLIAYNKLDPTVSSILINLPKALYSGLFRPSLLDARTIFQYWVGFENLVLLILTIGALFRIFRNREFPHRILIFSMVVYICILAAFMALSSPNFGTLVRYKIAFLPFFIYLIILNNPMVDKLFQLFKLTPKT
ncbi:MAG: hypothetical protein MI921_20010 [Cytophagales bacterium]|nr:hypothetical protein [Cytophagales bacterium]